MKNSADQPQIKQQLNPKIWNSAGRLRPGIRPALIRIAKDFKKFVGIDFAVVDVVITGSQAGTTWTAHSDLDLHLIVDYASIDCDRELEELFDTKRHLYNRRFNIKVWDIPVELYVEDLAEPARGPAWSLALNQWIRKPQASRQQSNSPENLRGDLARSLDMWSKIITAAIESKDAKILKKTMILLKKYREIALKNQGEFSVANLAYKTLRNQGLLAKLAQATDLAVSRSLSIG